MAVSVKNYDIREITYREAMDMVVANHYLRRKAPAMFTYGMFDGDTMIGCIVYGKPASPSLCVGICGPEESGNVIELTRLWISDVTPKNAESYLIGATLKMLPIEYDIVVSYAEAGVGHIGVVYQATNFIYTGLSSKHVQWKIEGVKLGHERHQFDEHGGVNGAKEFYGDKMTRHERPRKHRYIMFRGSSKRRKELRGKLRYPVEPYPKVLENNATKLKEVA